MTKTKTPATGQKVIEIPSIRLERISVTIEGQTPLIVHRFGERAREQLEAKQQKLARGAKEARDPQAEFEDSLYVIPDRDGLHGSAAPRYGFPAIGIKKCLVTAGGRFTDGKMTELRGIVNVLGDLLEIHGSEPVRRADTVRLAGGVSSIAYRPAFMPWSIEVPVVFNGSLIREEQIVNLFQIGGFAIGLGDWRPEKNGTFGTFIVGSVSR